VKTGPMRNGFQLLQRSVQFDFVKLSLLVITYVEKRSDKKPSSQKNKNYQVHVCPHEYNKILAKHVAKEMNHTTP